MSGTDVGTGTLPELCARPSSTVFCLLPGAGGFGRTRRSAGGPYAVPAGPLPFACCTELPAGLEGTAS